MLTTKIIEKKEYLLAVNALEDYEVVAFPTETVMGLAIDAFNLEAYNNLVNVKNRPQNKAFPFIVANSSEIEKYAIVNNKIQKVINSFLPGPLTIVLKKKESVPSFVTGGKDTIAIRIPDEETVLRILKEFGKPILLTSANKSGENSTLNSTECYQVFNGEIKYIIQGECLINKASTIVDLSSDEIKVLREGKISLEDIKKIMEE